MERFKYLLLLFIALPIYSQSLEHLLDKQHLTGNIQLYTYAIGDEDPNSEGAYATALGGVIGYRYRWENHVGINFDYAGSHALGPSVNFKRLHLFNNDIPSIHLNTIARANVFYSDPNTVARFGYQTLDTPLFNVDSTRIVPWSSESFTLSHIHENKIRAYLSFVNRIRSNTSHV